MKREKSSEEEEEGPTLQRVNSLNDGSNLENSRLVVRVDEESILS